MKKKRFILFAALAALLCAAPMTVQASDHSDGPQASANEAADITDLYSWMSDNGAKVYLVENLYKAATATTLFDPTIQYVFHIKSYPAFAGPPVPSPGPAITLICTFAGTAAPQTASCWLTQASATAGSPPTVLEYVTGNASNSAMPLVSTDGNLKIFAGLRADPFFFNEAGFVTVAGMVASAAPSLTLDAAGCPAIPLATAMALVSALSSNPVNTFAGLDVLSIVAVVNKTIITPAAGATAGGPVLAIWASTNMGS